MARGGRDSTAKLGIPIGNKELSVTEREYASLSVLRETRIARDGETGWTRVGENEERENFARRREAEGLKEEHSKVHGPVITFHRWYIVISRWE